MKCEVCGEADSMPYTCSRCGDQFCVSHRLPESHDCTGLAVEKAHRASLREDGTEVPWFQNQAHESDSTGSTSTIGAVVGLFWIIITVPFRTKFRIAITALLVLGVYIYI